MNQQTGAADYVRNRYGIEARRLGRVVFDGKPGQTTGFADGYVLVKLDGARHSVRCHPTWRMEYLPKRTSDEAILERLRSRSTVNPETGCWEWQGNAVRGGYGTTGVDNTTRFVHRMAWEIANGPIPDGLLCCHKCDNPPCWNPDHIFLGTNADNAADRVAKGRQGVSANSTKTHCKQGHEFSEANTYTAKNGGRHCRRCKADCEQRRRARS